MKSHIVLEKVSLIWQLLGENKESLQGLGSILNPLAIFTGSVLIQIWLNIQNAYPVRVTALT